MNKVGILGYGKVGQALSKFYKTPKIKDIKRDDGLKGVDVLHICVPWSEKFIDIAVKEIKNAEPKLTIIHSSVDPGTTAAIIKKLPRGLKNVVHSPVRGIHPHLYEGIKIFIKYIGAENKKVGIAAKKHLKSLGIKTKVFIPAATTELGKLLDTTYYGLAIAWHGEMEKMCAKVGVNFDEAVTDFNKTYNDGYTKLGKKNVVRPVLKPPIGGIGGHCIIHNAELLKEFLNSKATQAAEGTDYPRVISAVSKTIPDVNILKEFADSKGIDLVLKYKPKKKWESPQC